MNNKEIRKKALGRLSYYWAEAEFMFLIEFCLIAVFPIAAYILLLIIYPDLVTIDFDWDLSQAAEILISNNAVKAVAVILPAVMLVLLSPLYFGVKWCYYKAAQGKNAPVSGAFYGYYSLRKWGRAIILNLIVILRKLVYFIPIAAVGGAIYYIFINILNSTESSFVKTLLYVGIIIVFIGLFLIFMICTVKLQLIPYYFAEEPEKGIFEIYHEGISAMNGSRGRFAALQIWFVPLLVLCGTGFLSMFVIPFYSMVKSICAAEISGGKLFDEQTDTEEEKTVKETVQSTV